MIDFDFINGHPVLDDTFSPEVFEQANTEKPEWSEEEVQVREEVINDVGDSGGFTEAGLKKQIMVDRSAPVVGGESGMCVRITQILLTSSRHSQMLQCLQGRFPLHKAGLMCLKSHSLLPTLHVNKPGELETLSSKKREWQHPRLPRVSQVNTLF